MDRTGYIDLQVNGYAGIDFNSDSLTAEGLHTACEALRRDGVEGILATIITDAIDTMASRIQRVVELRERDELAQQLIVGMHIEGPFINEQPGFRGAHPEEAIHPADLDEMRRLIDAGGGLVRLTTLAPERDRELAVTRWLRKQGIAVSAGHCDPTLDQLDAAIDAGLSAWTHLGNGCPMQMHRHDNVVQRALSRSDRLWLCFIADGVHVPFHALDNYLRLAGDRGLVVSDAISAAGFGPGRHRIGRWEVEVGEDLAVWAPDRSHLVGSAMTMRQAEANLNGHLHLDAEHIAGLTRERPLALLAEGPR